MRVVWLRRAIRDLEAVRDFVARDKPEAAQRLAGRLRKAVEVLAEQPGIGRPGRVPGTRELVVTNTPYLIPYRVRDQIIEILRVLHAARRWPEEL